jgi:hypothetical protein
MGKRIACAGAAWSFCLAAIAVGQSATRDLAAEYVPPGSIMPVSIALSTPGGTASMGLEDRPPAGWTVSNISHSGSVDGTGKVKWGPFIGGPYPAAVTYDVTPAPGSGTGCFSGTANFDGLDVPIAGDECILAIPATSTWGLLALGQMLAIAGTLTLGRRS